MKIEVVRAFCLAGEAQAPGTVLDVEDGLGLELIALRKAVGHVPAEKPARARKAKAEATVDEPAASAAAPADE